MEKKEEYGQKPNGVVIPEEVIADSRVKKAKRGKTLSELPVYRDTANLLVVVADMVARSPVALRKFYDELLAALFEMLFSIGLADFSKENPVQRVECINSTLSLAYAVKTSFAVLRKLHILTKDADNKQRALVKRIIAQLVGWRDYTRSEGVESGVQSNEGGTAI